MLILNPIFLFSIGTFIGLTPLIFNSKYFDSYSTFTFSYKVLIVYFIGYIFFLLGVLTINCFYKERENQINYIRKKDLNLFITILIVLSIFIFIKIISLYGTLPILSILSGSEGITYVNETQKDVGGGIFGVFFLMVISLIILYPYIIIYKNSSFFNKILFYIYTFLLIIYTTYSGKRQMIFILFTYTFSYFLIYYKRVSNNEKLKYIKRKGFIFLMIIVTIFIFIGLLRSNLLNEDVSIFNPIIHYASLPFMNLTNIILHQDQNNFAYSFIAIQDFILSDLPTFIKYIFVSNFISLPMPYIEKTSPPTIYGMVFWEFGHLGVIFHLYTIGLFVSYLYKKALYSKKIIYISLYSLIVWPLLSIHTYNHFKNFMFLIIPILLIIIGQWIYQALPKKRKTSVAII